MTQKETKERNKHITLMLGYSNPIEDKDFYFVEHKNYNEDSVIPKLLELNFEKRFHLDWNWLMEAVTKVYSLITPSDSIKHDLIQKVGRVQKEAVFIAVSDFAKLYNSKQL